MKKAKAWNYLGLVIGLLVIVIGITFIFTPADSYSTNSADDMAFGADFYTYQYEATQIATENTAVTANNIRELSNKVALYSGTLFILLGTLVVLHYGKQCFVVEDIIDNKHLRDEEETELLEN